MAASVVPPLDATLEICSAKLSIDMPAFPDPMTVCITNFLAFFLSSPSSTDDLIIVSMK